MQANIFADGAMLSITDTADYPGLGRLPLSIASELAERQSQFVLLGSLVGSNTVGGCTAEKPVLGDGTRIERPTSAQRAEACLYDVNYFRTSPMVFEGNDELGTLIWPESGPQLAWQLFKLSNNTQAQSISAMRNAVTALYNRGNLIPGEYAVVNFVYQAPPDGLPSGVVFTTR